MKQAIHPLVRLRPGYYSKFVISTIVAIASSTVLMGAPPAGATVSGDNGMIAFATDRDGNSEIYVMDSDGANPVNLTRHSAADKAPNWSPDGRQIVFVSNRTGIDEIFSMNADGTDQRRLATGIQPTWSPDGSRIAFSNGGSIWTMATDGGNVVRVSDGLVIGTRGACIDFLPSWSPDGSKIAFQRYCSVMGQTYMQLWAKAPSPSAAEVLITHSGWSADAPDWSPDGAQITFGTHTEDDVASLVTIINADGSGIRVLPNPAAFSRTGEPSWSPDGTVIVATAVSTNVMAPEVVLLDPDGSGAATNLTNHPASDSDPAWQPLNPYAIGLVDPMTGTWYLRSESAAVTSFYFGNPGDYPFMGDWDCDGTDTPGLFRLTDAFAYVRNSNSEGVADIRFFFGNPSDVPLAGDFDGDGCDTLSLYRPSEQRFYIINRLGENDGGLGPADFSFLFGNPGDKPFVGDFDGDGIDEFGLHRESTGLVYYRTTLDTGVASNEFFFGDPGDRFVTGDWGIVDGVDTPGLFRSSNTTFYFRHANSEGNADSQFIWGQPGWLPVAGSYGRS